MIFQIEYVIPPFNMVDYTSIKAKSEREAVHFFKLEYPQATIKHITKKGDN